MIRPSNGTLGTAYDNVQHSNHKTQSIKYSQLKIKFTPVVLSSPLNNSRDTVYALRRIWDNNLITIQEQVYALFLNASNQVISYRCLHTGTTQQTLFDIKLTLACALGCLAGKIIIAHNHPDGILRPTPGDVVITEQFKSACELMDIKLIDHIIINQYTYYSFKDDRIIL